ncbi:MAG: hypothetical protein UY74_C0014G0010 [Candidatus Kaiserbacteria bacterium GW2011_GWC2_52_8b]|uniref:Nudix hydrolase domain-containing protein n=2 Tax=Candidatus Kaiseribacteriota TaxID=1752734 RepID=A0A0G1XKM4_9BACT|nr:MAG: hypothetical protein UY67_C0006G0025 [Candidatus Kaiserbacteria bacterium GW2011_GWA2_52_12]KKW31430.1 MAG: hypothetical protein UY74_C0014G0010 [Candidatus Kaiserbacteria bacterium GW2011_GWC2_52_8b]
MYTDPIYREEGHFETGPNLPLEQYRAALRRMVKYCHDVIFIDPADHFLLAQRAPGRTAAGTWYIGGQVSAFTAYNTSLTQMILRETGLTIDEGRFRYLAQNRYWFNDAQGHVAQDSLCDVFTIKLTEQEIAHIALDPEEYVPGSLRSYGTGEVAAIPEPLPRQVFMGLWDRYTALKKAR